MPPIRSILSKQNPSLKQLRALLLKPQSNTDRLVAIEGFHLLEEALASRVPVKTIFVAAGRESTLDSLKIPSHIEILAVPANILAAAVSTEAPQPVAALIQQPDWSWNFLLDKPNPLLVILAGLQDPGNLGTILRSAEAFGATGAILLPGTVSPWNSKALRASAGSVFRLPILHASAEQCFAQLDTAGIQSLAAMAHDAQPLDSFPLTGPLAFIIGSEGSGLAPEIAARCQHRVTIPCPGPVESLNAAVAASILLYQAAQARAVQDQPEQARPAQARRSR